MQQIFVNEEPIEGRFTVTGDDMHHLVRVVRIKKGEIIRVSTAAGNNYLCAVSDILDKELLVDVTEQVNSTELSNKIYLFQAIPKGDKMETIIEKTVELGVFEIIPVQMKNCIVKLDDKKKKNKLSRYQTVALTAAKQSKRSIVPAIHDVLSFKEAMEYAANLDLLLLPYESKNGMKDTYDVINGLQKGQSVGIFIGPEGGFDESEIELVKDKCKLISLGRRILRTETAAICSLSMFMLKSEELELQ
ncbi:RsmE family RNA methyltransferase [Pseudobutyrivibrio ruminis]|uniref:Ribosomal RNA small subunit methyltransferase E n=1 Tax=Pseudobutyrivibrio ruminis DSM 9787 TaxID=1123011 RepID=A0A285RE63_9FIRM|nr:16S rRNA (uracil(1498)-N(3))-methyltransferase [Pseudobutyrivibrio ruminis]SOB91969.1 16S rRNA (uracil1498-N3)-methyltransferase [Pseudobutyrivibrio ruminis DSM 9787]